MRERKKKTICVRLDTISEIAIEDMIKRNPLLNGSKAIRRFLSIYYKCLSDEQKNLICSQKGGWYSSLRIDISFRS